MRRLATLTVSPSFLLAIAQVGSVRVAKNAPPPDARVVYHELDARGDLVLTLRSEAFAPVPKGETPPAIAPPIFRRVP